MLQCTYFVDKIRCYSGVNLGGSELAIAPLGSLVHFYLVLLVIAY